MNREEKIAHYRAMLHAVQTGIAWKIALDHPEVSDINSDSNLREHKHLRTGIDGSKSDHGALVELLIRKGVITDEEYIDAMVAGAEREVKLYEAELTAHFGRTIKLA